MLSPAPEAVCAQDLKGPEQDEQTQILHESRPVHLYIMRQRIQI